MIFQITKDIASSISFWDKLLINAAVLGDLDDLETALTFGAQVTTRKDGWTPLLGAAQNGHADVCHLLLSCGSDIEEREVGSENTALHEAALFGHLSTIEVLLNWAPEKGETLVNYKNAAGYTPLTNACQQKGHHDCVIALLMAGAVPMQTNNRSWPTHAAAQHNNLDIVETLLDYGCGLELVGYSISPS